MLEEDVGSRIRPWSLVGSTWPFNTNASLESLWRNKDEICPPCAPLGTFLGGLVHTIEELGKEHQGFLQQQDRPNMFISLQKVRTEVWNQIVSRHPKSLIAVSLVHKDPYINEIFCEVTEEIYDIGDVTMPLHLKLEEWHS